MHPVNMLGLETRHGFRTVDLLEGDITALEFPVDVLVVSAFAGSYLPTKGTVMKSLVEQLEVDLRDYAVEPALDLRNALCTWISKPLAETEAFGRILCVEIVGTHIDPDEALDNVFASLLVLEAKGVNTETIAMPLLGAGSQRLEPRSIATVLVQRTRDFLQRSLSTSRVSFVEINTERAAVISDAIDEVLGRARVTLPQEQITTALKQDVIHRLSKANDLFNLDRQQRDDWVRLLQKPRIEASEFGVMGRKLVELILNKRSVPKQHLYQRIRHLEETKTVAPWICGYMNVLRHLGNDSAHVNESMVLQKPREVAPGDLVTGLFCVLRLVEFSLDHPA